MEGKHHLSSAKDIVMTYLRMIIPGNPEVRDYPRVINTIWEYCTPFDFILEKCAEDDLSSIQKLCSGFIHGESLEHHWDVLSTICSSNASRTLSWVLDSFDPLRTILHRFRIKMFRIVCARGDIMQATMICERYPITVNELRGNDHSALYWACRSGNIKMVDFILHWWHLDSSEVKMARDPSNILLLSQSCDSRHWDMTKFLLDVGGWSRDEYKKAAIHACIARKDDIVNMVMANPIWLRGKDAIEIIQVSAMFNGIDFKQYLVDKERDFVWDYIEELEKLAILAQAKPDYIVNHLSLIQYLVSALRPYKVQGTLLLVLKANIGTENPDEQSKILHRKLSKCFSILKGVLLSINKA